MNGLSSSNILGVPWLWLSKVRKTQVTYLILDISEKAGAINSNQKLFGEEGFAEEGSDDLKYLQKFVKLEEKVHCQPLNYDDNRGTLKKLAKEHKDFVNYKWMWTYQSTSRTLFRGCWFFDFLEHVMNGITDRDAKMSKIATEGYNHGLGPHHGFMLRSVAGIAMKAIQGRDKFIAGFIAEQSTALNMEYTEDILYEDFAKLSESSGILAKHLWALCKENGFDKLP